MMLVAALGKIPRFFCRFLALSSSSSSPVPSPDPTLASPRNEPVKMSPVGKNNQKKRKIMI